MKKLADDTRAFFLWFMPLVTAWVIVALVSFNLLSGESIILLAGLALALAVINLVAVPAAIIIGWSKGTALEGALGVIAAACVAMYLSFRIFSV